MMSDQDPPQRWWGSSRASASLTPTKSAASKDVLRTNAGDQGSPSASPAPTAMSASITPASRPGPMDDDESRPQPGPIDEHVAWLLRTNAGDPLRDMALAAFEARPDDVITFCLGHLAKLRPLPLSRSASPISRGASPIISSNFPQAPPPPPLLSSGDRTEGKEPLGTLNVNGDFATQVTMRLGSAILEVEPNSKLAAAAKPVLKELVQQAQQVQQSQETRRLRPLDTSTKCVETKVAHAVLVKQLETALTQDGLQQAVSSPQLRELGTAVAHERIQKIAAQSPRMRKAARELAVASPRVEKLWAQLNRPTGEVDTVVLAKLATELSADPAVLAKLAELSTDEFSKSETQQRFRTRVADPLMQYAWRKMLPYVYIFVVLAFAVVAMQVMTLVRLHSLD